jgi:hypothetical protein
MIFVVGLWTFLRALFLEPATFALENLARLTNSPSSMRIPIGLSRCTPGSIRST